MKNPYEVLGVRQGASLDEIKSAYRELVKKYHPDKYKDNPLESLAQEKMQEINEAYDQIVSGRASQNTSQQNTYQQWQDPFAAYRQFYQQNQQNAHRGNPYGQRQNGYYNGYGYGYNRGCGGSGGSCCDMLCNLCILDSLCECMGGDLCSCM